MLQSKYTIESNARIAHSIYRMALSGDTSAITDPGQFVEIALPGRFLRRPISVCDAEEGKLTLIYKVVGHGTHDMSRMEKGEKLDIISGLGNGYDLTVSGDKPLLIGGGVGVPPLYMLAKRLINQGKTPTVILGFNTRDEVFCENEFKALGCKVFVTTADGSCGIKGFVTDALPAVGEYSYYYCCGPEPMLRAIYNRAAGGGEYSFEARMGCGFGACMGCSIMTKSGSKRVCREGPVFKKEDIIWAD